MKTTLKDFKSLNNLKSMLRNNQEIEQNHFGDYLMIREPEEWTTTGDNYRVWLNHPENVKQGEPVWCIEYAGKENGYKWEIVGQGND